MAQVATVAVVTCALPSATGAYETHAHKVVGTQGGPRRGLPNDAVTTEDNGGGGWGGWLPALASQ